MDAYKSSGVLLASAARTATLQTGDIVSGHERGVQLFFNITANPGGVETLTPQIQAKDPVSGAYESITALTALTAATNALFLVTLYPGGAETVATNRHEVQALPLPKIWRVYITHSASGSFTYSVGYSTLV